MDKHIAGVEGRQNTKLSDAQKKKLAKPEKREMPAQQKRVLKWIALFFGLMLAFAILSRAADSITVPMVTETATIFASTLNYKVTASGSIETVGAVSVPVEAGYRVSEIPVTEGQSVKAGDVLARFDQNYLQEKLTEAQDAVTKAELSERLKSISDSDADAYKETAEAKRKALEREMEDSSYTLQGKETAVQTAQEGVVTAREKLSNARLALDEALSKAREKIIKEADENLEKAQKTWIDAQIAYSDSVNSANRTFEDARTAYYKALTPATSSSDTEGLEDGASSTVVDNSAAIAEAEKTWQRAQEDYSKSMFKAEKTKTEAESTYEKASQDVAEAQSKPLEEQTDVVTAQTAVDTAISDLSKAEDTVLEKIADRDSSQRTTERSLVDKVDAVSDAVEADMDAISKQARKDAIQAQKDSVQSQIDAFDMQEKYDKVEKIQKMIAGGGALLAPQDGTVTKISLTVGSETTAGTAVELGDVTKGYRFKATAQTTDVKLLKQGDNASILPAGSSTAVEGAVIESIRPLTGDKTGQSEIVASLPAKLQDAAVGTSGDLIVEKRSQKYNSCVKAAALMGTQNDRYVLVIREKQSILGVQNTVEKVSVRVLGQDSSNVALEDGSLSKQDQFVLASTRPLTDKERIRLQVASNEK